MGNVEDVSEDGSGMSCPLNGGRPWPEQLTNRDCTEWDNSSGAESLGDISMQAGGDMQDADLP